MAQQNPAGAIIGGGVALVALYLIVTNMSKIQAAFGTSFAPTATGSSATAGFAAGFASALGLAPKPTTATLANLPASPSVNPAGTYSAGSPLAGTPGPDNMTLPSESSLDVGLNALSN
jgi:hypothetical protein